MRSPLRAAVAMFLCLAVPAFGLDAAGPETRAHARSSTELPADDKTEILDLIARMNQAIDANDYSEYASFYSDEGTIDSGFGPLSVGRPAIIASLEQSAPFITNKRHVASNIVINGDAQSATAVYYLTVFERSASISVVGTAVITDTLEKTDGRWTVTSHSTRMDPATLEAMSQSLAAPARE